MNNNLLLHDIKDRMKRLDEISARIERQRYHFDIHPEDFPAWKGDVHQIPFSDADTEISSVFTEAGLNAQNPVHWRALVEIFCKAYVKHQQRPSHRSKEWAGADEAALAATILKLRLQQSEPNNTELARLLRKLPKYVHLSEATLRHHVSRMNFQYVLQLADEFPTTFKEAVWGSD